MTACADHISVCGAWLSTRVLCQTTLGRRWWRCYTSITVSRLQLPALIKTAAQSADDDRRRISRVGRHCSQLCNTVNT